MFCRPTVAAAFVFSVASTASTLALAQSPTVHDKTQDARLDAIEKQIAALEALTTKQTASVTGLKDLISDQESRVSTLTTKVNEFEARIKSQLDLHDEILKQISRKDGTRYVPEINAAMSASDKFRQDMDSAVHRSLKEYGTLYISNKTGTYQWISVNQTQQFLQPGEQKAIPVRVGTATTQIPGHQLQTWTITSPKYEERLDIVPTFTPRTYVARPMYSDAPQYFGTPYLAEPPRRITPPLYVEAPILTSTAPLIDTLSITYR